MNTHASIVLSDACHAYARTAQERLQPRTLSNRRSQLRQLCAALGGLRLDEVTTDHLERYARARLHAGLRPVSVNGELRAWNALRTWARAHGYAAGPAAVELPERNPFRVRSWTPAEVGGLLEAAALVSPAIVPLLVCLANTGMRRGEALALRWDAVDLAGRILRVWPSLEWSPKSGEPREVPIGDALLELLERLPRTSSYVFPARSGGRFAYWPQRAFDRARRAAGLTGGPHTLRHTFATEWIARRGSLPALAQVLGHSDARVTRLYAHLRREHLADVRNLVVFPFAAGAASQRKSRRKWTLRALGTLRAKVDAWIEARLR